MNSDLYPMVISIAVVFLVLSLFGVLNGSDDYKPLNPIETGNIEEKNVINGNDLGSPEKNALVSTVTIKPSEEITPPVKKTSIKSPTPVPESQTKTTNVEKFTPPKGSNVFGEVSNTQPQYTGKISIDSIGTFSYDPRKVKTVRRDLFSNNHFSVFDVLVYLNSIDEIDLDYEFYSSLDTHIIKSLNGKSNWWYMAYYDGGWPEQNNFRMDYFPYKDKMTIRLYTIPESRLDIIFSYFKDEVERKEKNSDEVIIPKVYIRSPQYHLTFENVNVTAHNLRTDTFQRGKISAIDTILSLGDQGEITYDLQWYESIGSADIVKNYFVNGINDDKAYRTCGFVYEAGPERGKGYLANHIHIPSDLRLIYSPEYVEYFWICL